jgi:hypothetical protein
MYRIYILSHNRPNSIIKCIKSVEEAAKNHAFVEIVISENSSNNKVLETLKESNIKSTVIDRLNYMTGVEHINFCLNEAKKDEKINYVCIFHDDDLMNKDFICKSFEGFSKFPDAAAIAFDISSTWRIKKDIFYNKEDLINNIFSVNSSSIIPFPSFSYNLNLINSIELKNNIGKHCDVEFLLNVANIGRVLIIRSQQMMSVIHDGSDSYNESISARRGLLNDVVRNHRVNKSFLKGYRMAYILRKKRLNSLKFFLNPRKRFLKIYISYLFKKLCTYKKYSS